MQKFAEIQARAIERKGGAQALQDLLPTVMSEAQPRRAGRDPR